MGQAWASMAGVCDRGGVDRHKGRSLIWQAGDTWDRGKRGSWREAEVCEWSNVMHEWQDWVRKTGHFDTYFRSEYIEIRTQYRFTVY